MNWIKLKLHKGVPLGKGLSVTNPYFPDGTHIIKFHLTQNG